MVDNNSVCSMQDKNEVAMHTHMYDCTRMVCISIFPCQIPIPDQVKPKAHKATQQQQVVIAATVSELAALFCTFVSVVVSQRTVY